jgi:hypothetical protein
VAEFADERHFAGALAMLRDAGYDGIETYTPYPVDRTHSALPMPPSIIPFMVFLGGLAGGAISYWIQWYANAVSYPLNIGGRPAHAAPAFFIPTFEGTVLAASLTAFAMLLLVLRFPRPWHPVFEADGIERASNDHFFIAIDMSDSRADTSATPRTLRELGALNVTWVWGG